jgi:hypothetical protein
MQGTYIKGCEKVYNSFYVPKKGPSILDFSLEQQSILKAVQEVHTNFGHISGQGLIRLLKKDRKLSDTYNISIRDVEFWLETIGRFCHGCVQGNMLEHDRIPTSVKKEYKIGEAATGDILFLDQIRGGRKPMFILVDYGAKLIIGVPMESKEESEIIRAVKFCKGFYSSWGHNLSELVFDRESAIVSAKSEIMTECQIRVTLKAAGQHSGLVEVNNRKVRQVVRATRNGIRNDQSYEPLIQWIEHFAMDAISTLNRTILPGYEMSPYELFTRQSVDLARCFRVQLGEIVLAKKPSGIASDMDCKA